jgi:hypothetical protein
MVYYYFISLQKSENLTVFCKLFAACVKLSGMLALKFNTFFLNFPEFKVALDESHWTAATATTPKT